MRTIGLVGGTGWVSTVDYYRYINQEFNEVLGGYQFPRCILYSLNFGDIVDFNKKNDTESIYHLLLDATGKVISGGAEGIVLCANTLHKYADRIQEKIDKPIIHIADATAGVITENKLSKVSLLGTKYTMEEDFYRTRLEASNIEVIVPGKEDRLFIHRAIFNELIKEIFLDETKERFLNIMQSQKKAGAQGIILGCTEIPLIIKDHDFDLPLLNTTLIHAGAAVQFALGD